MKRPYIKNPDTHNRKISDNTAEAVLRDFFQYLEVTDTRFMQYDSITRSNRKQSEQVILEDYLATFEE
jgi:hypothetical protein